MQKAESIAIQSSGDGWNTAEATTTNYDAGLRPAPERSHRSLSAREKEVLYWLALGRSGKDIARVLNIGVCTVRAHIRNIIRKLDAVNIPHAVARAFQEGALQLGDPQFTATK